MKKSLFALGLLLLLACPLWAQPAIDKELLINRTPLDKTSAITRVGLDGTVIEELTDGHLVDFDACWSPDREKVVFATYDRPSETFQINVVDKHGGDRNTLYEQKKGALLSPVYSPDGNWIAFTAVDSKGEIPFTYVMKSDGSNPRAISPPLSAFPTWSPDSKKVLYVRGDGTLNKAVVETADLESGEYRTILAGSDQILACAYSPDGQMLALTRKVSPKTTQICLMGAQGGPLTPITKGQDGVDFGVRFSEDGKQLYFNRIRVHEAAVWRVNLDGSNPRRITAGLQGGGVMFLLLR